MAKWSPVLKQERSEHTEALHTFGCQPNLRRNLLVKISLYGFDGHHLPLLEKVALRFGRDFEIRVVD